MRRLVMALVLLPLLTACGQSTPSQAPRPDDAYSLGTHFDIMGVLPDGSVRGRTIHADGRYVSWVQAAAGEPRRRLRTFTVPADEVAALFDTLRRLGFLELETAAVDPAVDYATGMVLHGPGGTHQLAWEQARDVPAELRGIAQTFARWEHERG